MGLERLIMTMESQGCEFIKTPECDLYIVNAGAEVMGKVIFLANQLRQDGHRVEYDLMGRSMKAQMKYADKLGAAFVTVIGEDEIKSGQAKLKHMSDGKEFPVSIDSSLPETFMNIILSNVLF
jgi:histidyl-tRNA synthetase